MDNRRLRGNHVNAEEFVHGIAKNLETLKQNLGKPTMRTAKMLERSRALQQDFGGSNSPVSVGGGKGIDNITYQTEELKIKIGQTFMALRWE